VASRSRDQVAALVPARRTFIKVGLVGASLFAVGRWGCDVRAASPGYRVLDDKSAAMVKALAPVVLASSLPEDAAARDRAVTSVVQLFDRAVAGLAPAVQREIADLFSFLDFAPTRLAFAGLWTSVAESTPEELAAFLTRWRQSRFELQQASYQAITQLIHASWYDLPESWGAIGYAGPPSLGAR
jgi:hypothetical protein